MNNETHKKFEIECAICKTKFDIWISMARYSSELEENIRKNLYRHCPVCRILEELKALENNQK